MTNVISTNQGFKEVKSISEATLEQGIFTDNANVMEKKSINFGESDFSEMQSLVSQYSVVQKLVQNVTTPSDSFEFVQENLNNNAQWGSDLVQNPASRLLINTFEVIVQPKATNKFLRDLGSEANAAMLDKVARAFARAQNNAYINGDGQNCPRGLLTYSSSEISQVSSASITAQSITDLIDCLDSSYMEGASFLISPFAAQQIKNLTDASGHFIYQISTSGDVSKIYGIPVYITSDMPNDKIILANFKQAYISVENANANLVTDPLTEKPFIKYYAVKKVGGDVVNKDAIKILAIA